MTRLINYYMEHCLLFSKAERNFASLLLIAPISIRFCCRGGAVVGICAKKTPLGSFAARSYAGNHEGPSEHDYPYS